MHGKVQKSSVNLVKKCKIWLDLVIQRNEDTADKYR